MKTRTRIRLAALAATLITAVYAWAYNVSGTIVDSAGEPMIKASVRVLRPDSTLVKGMLTDYNGRFDLTDIKPGNYILETSYMGYGTNYRNIKIGNASLKVDSVTLSEASQVLDAVTVRGIYTPIKVMEDTIEFHAGSYKTEPNAVVEDLLRRLPGVEVGSDGTITANGRTVSKILVDGKEFFSDDPKVASRTLPVSMVDRLQVVDRKSDLSRLTGVDDGEEETVINLTVKKDMQNGWFGTIEGGYGTDNRYKGSFNINRFWNGNQLTFIGGGNNVNDLSFTDGGRRFRRFGGDNGITTSQAFGVNFNIGNGEILRLGGDVMYTHTSRDSKSSSLTEYLLTEGSRLQNNIKNSLDRGHNLRADLRLQWKPDSANTVDFRPNFSLNYNDSESDEYSDVITGGAFTNRSLNLQRSHGTSVEVGGRLIYNHNFLSHPGRSFSFQAEYSMSNMRERENALSIIRYYLDPDNTEDDPYDYFTDNHTWTNSVGGRLTWTEPLGDPKRGNFLEIAYRLQYKWSNADKITYDRPLSRFDLTNIDLSNPGNTLQDLPLWALELIDGDMKLDSLSNQFRNDYMNQDIRLGYKYVSKAHNLNVGVSLVPQMSKSIDILDSQRSIPERWVWNFAPYLRYRLKVSKTRSLNIDYRGRSSQPTMTQLQPVADYSDPLNVVQGNPDLLPSFTHNLRFRFQDFNQDAQRSIMAMAQFSLAQNSIVSKTTFTDNGGRYTTYENVNGVWSANVFSMFSMPFRNKSFTFNNFLAFNYNHNVGFNNGQRNNAGNLGISESFGIAWRPDHLELELRPEYRLQYATNSLATASNSTVHSFGGMFNGTWYSPIDIVLATNLRYSANRGYGNGYDKNEWLWNASISYQMLAGKALTLTVSGNDLLNQRSNIQRQVTGNYIKDSMYNTLGRYFMFTVSYKFNTFGHGNEPTSRNDRFRGPGGDGPGGGRPGGGTPPGPPPRM